MRFTVLWMPAALEQLSAIWLNATDRNEITATSYRIDRLLATRPIEVGESRGGAERILFEPPLKILYWIVLDDHRVEVFDVATTI